MLYATIYDAQDNPAYCMARALRKDLHTVKGYIAWARRTQANNKQCILQVWRSEHPDHIYGKDKLIHEQYI